MQGAADMVDRLTNILNHLYFLVSPSHLRFGMSALEVDDHLQNSQITKTPLKAVSQEDSGSTTNNSTYEGVLVGTNISWEVVIPFIVIAVSSLVALFFCFWNSRKARFTPATTRRLRWHRRSSKRKIEDPWRSSARSITPLGANVNKEDYIIPYLRSPGTNRNYQLVAANQQKPQSSKDSKTSSHPVQYINAGFNDLDESTRSNKEAVRPPWHSEPNIRERSESGASSSIYDPEVIGPEKRQIVSEPATVGASNDPFFPNYNTPVRTSNSSVSDSDTEIGIINYSYRSPFFPNNNTPTHNTPVSERARERFSTNNTVTVQIINPKLPSLSRGDSTSTSRSSNSRFTRQRSYRPVRGRLFPAVSQHTTPTTTTTPYPNSSYISSRDGSFMESPSNDGDANEELSQPSQCGTWRYNNMYTTKSETSSNVHAVNSQEFDSNNTSMCFPSDNTSICPIIGSGNTSLNPAVGSSNNTSDQHTTSGNTSEYPSGTHSEYTSASTSGVTSSLNLQTLAYGGEIPRQPMHPFAQVIISSLERNMENSTSTNTPDRTHALISSQLSSVNTPDDKTVPTSPNHTQLSGTKSHPELRTNRLAFAPDVQRAEHSHIVYKQTIGRPSSMIVSLNNNGGGIHQVRAYNGNVSIIQYNSPGSVPTLMESELSDHSKFSWWSHPALSKTQYWV